MENPNETTKDAVQYEERLVAFVDILGWSRAMGTMAPSEILAVLEPIRERAAFHNEGHRQAILEHHKGWVNPLMLAVQFGFFSDCFVLSMPVSHGDRILGSLSEISYRFLERGFATRGGVAAGPLYHLDNAVFGPALITAVGLEDTTKLARIQLDESAIEFCAVDDDLTAVVTDQDGLLVVDPFPAVAKHNADGSLIPMGPAAPILKLLARNAASLTEPSHRDKWRYLANLFTTSLEKYSAHNPQWSRECREIAARF